MSSTIKPDKFEYVAYHIAPNIMQLKLFEGEVFFSEVNFLTHPLGVLDKKAKKTLRSYAYKQVYQDDKNREIVNEWIISRGGEYDLPGPFEIDVLIAIFKLVYKHYLKYNSILGPVKITSTEVFKELGRKSCGSLYRNIDKAIHTWSHTVITARGTYYKDQLSGKTRRRQKGFEMPIFKLVFDADENITEESNNVYYLIFNEIFSFGFNSYYLKPLNSDFYFTKLSSATARRLYQILDYACYRNNMAEFDLTDLCALMGLTASRLAILKQTIICAAEELKKQEYVREIYFQKTSPGKWKVIFYLVEGAIEGLYKKKSTKNQMALLLPSMIQELVDRGVVEETAIKVCQNYPEEQIKKGIRHHDYLKGIGSPKVSKNASGFLVSAIVGDWALPDDIEKTVQKMARDKEREKARETARNLEDLKSKYDEWLKSEVNEKADPGRLETLISEEAERLAKQSHGIMKAQMSLTRKIAGAKIIPDLAKELKLMSFAQWVKGREL